MAATGLRFCAVLGAAWPPKEQGVVLLPVDLSGASQGGSLKCSRTGGDAWCLPTSADACSAAAGDTAAAAAAHPPTPIKCNSWDSKGRNPAMNVYVRLQAGGKAAGGEPPPRCKLGVLVQHALPQLAERLGGFRQLGLDWVTWRLAEPGGPPLPASVAPLPGAASPNSEHWAQLLELAKERETGAGTGGGSPPPPNSHEELVLRRAKETLVAAAAYFGPEAVEKVGKLTVRKLYQREFHFYYEGKDVADSRRHALEWAVGLAEADELLSRNPEARAKLNERLTGPGTGESARKGKPKQVRAPKSGQQGSTGRRVVLTARSGSGVGMHLPLTAAPPTACALAGAAGLTGLGASLPGIATPAASMVQGPAGGRVLQLSGSGAAAEQHSQLLSMLLQPTQRLASQSLEQQQQHPQQQPPPQPQQQQQQQKRQRLASPQLQPALPQRSAQHLQPLPLQQQQQQQPPQPQWQPLQLPSHCQQQQQDPLPLQALPLQQQQAAQQLAAQQQGEVPQLAGAGCALPATSVGPPTFSTLLDQLQAPPSWLASELFSQTNHEVPGGGGIDISAQRASILAEVSQPSPTREDLPVQWSREEQPAVGPVQQQPGRLNVLPTKRRQQRSGALPLPQLPQGPAATAALQTGQLQGAAAAAAGGAGEKDPLDAALEAWEAHDNLRRELTAVQGQLAASQNECARLQRQLQLAGSWGAAAAAQLASPRAAAAQLAALRARLPQAVRSELLSLLHQRPELLPHAAALGELGSLAAERAIEAWLGPPAVSDGLPAAHEAAALAEMLQ